MSWAEQAAWVTSNVVTEQDPRGKRFRPPAQPSPDCAGMSTVARAGASDAYFGAGSGAQLNDLAWSSAAP
jgi:hypothetical protein